MNANQRSITAVPDLGWKVAATGDYNGDGRADILWRHGTSGSNGLWYSANAQTYIYLTRIADTNWKIVP